MKKIVYHAGVAIVILCLCGFIGQTVQKGYGNISNSDKVVEKDPLNEMDFLLEQSAYPPESAPFRITKIDQSAILESEKKGFDCVDVLNPSVVFFKDQYLNLYSGYDGSIWRTGLATSKDGLSWQKRGQVFDVSSQGWDSEYIAANGSAVFFQNELLYYYQGESGDGMSKIGLAKVEENYDVIRIGDKPILSVGEKGTWDSHAVADPYVIEHNGDLYLYYLGMDEVGIQRLGIAKSSDGRHFVKSGQNPILDIGTKGNFDEYGLGEPSVVYVAPYFYMIYTGRNKREERNIGFALSLDGIHFKKQNNDGLIRVSEDAWNSKVICDTSILFDEKERELLVYYGGGNKAEPAQNLNGKIGIFYVDVNQKRDMYQFDVNADWSNALVKSSDVFMGSYELERNEDGKNQIWVKKDASIQLLNEKDKNQIEISLYVPDTILEQNDTEIEIFINNENMGITKVKESQVIIQLPKDRIKNIGDRLKIKIHSNSMIESNEDERELAYLIGYIKQV